MSNLSGNGQSSMSVRYWGTRGSVPSPGPRTGRYGGNTPCLEVEAGRETLILDAGTGIRELGLRMLSHTEMKAVTLFLTHFHWDHIQGFPFFAPAYDPGFQIQILGPTQDTGTTETLLRGQMQSGYFPIPPEALSARLQYQELDEGTTSANGIHVQTMRMRHASFTLGYRLSYRENTLVYIPDNELVGGNYPARPQWRSRLLEFISGADLLIHDAMYTDQEYANRRGWGHSTFSQAVELAREAGIGQLHFFHHSPERSDGEMDRILHSFRTSSDPPGPTVQVDAAREGSTIELSRFSQEPDGEGAGPV